MTAASDMAAAARSLAAALRSVADDPADQVRLMLALASISPVGPSGSGPVGRAIAAGRVGTAALVRRAALTQLARASAAYAPRNADDAEALRDLVCGALGREEIAAGDAGEDAVFAAFRALRLAVAADLTARGANLARLRDIETPTPAPALALAQRLYGDGARADGLIAASDTIHPLFLPTRFRAEAA